MLGSITINYKGNLLWVIWCIKESALKWWWMPSFSLKISLEKLTLPRDRGSEYCKLTSPERLLINSLVCFPIKVERGSEAWLWIGWHKKIGFITARGDEYRAGSRQEAWSAQKSALPLPSHSSPWPIFSLSTRLVWIWESQPDFEGWAKQNRKPKN